MTKSDQTAAVDTTGAADTRGDPVADIAAELPYLRRYARALTGNQDSGDRYAVATLEAILADSSILDGKAGRARRSVQGLSLRLEQQRVAAQRAGRRSERRGNARRRRGFRR